MGARIRELRMARGLSQADLAGPDFSKGFISLVETGRTRVSLRAAVIFARRLGVPTTELISAAGAADARRLELAAAHAEQHLTTGHPGRALEIAEAALRAAPDVQRSRFLRVRGRGLLQVGRAREAIAPLEEAVRRYRAEGNPLAALRAQLELAEAHAASNALADAIALALDVERALKEGSVVDKPLHLRLARFLMTAFTTAGEFGAADLRAEQAQALANDVGDPESLAALYSGLSRTREEQGDIASALDLAKRGLDEWAKLERRSELCRSWTSLARLHARRRHFGRAGEALLRASAIAEQASDPQLRDEIALVSSQLATKRGQHEEAERLASAVAARAATDAIRAEALFAVATAVAGQVVALPRLRAAFERAVTASAALASRRQALLHEEFARALAARDRFKDAMAEFEHALDLYRPAAAD